MKSKSPTPDERLLAPIRNDDELHAWLVEFCCIRVPRAAVCAGHIAPFDYVRRAYFEPSRDQVVHAPRGGGKTRLAAAATLLDLLHKPGISVRILGGSLDQSMRMWEHLLPDLERIAEDLIESRRSTRRITLTNRSGCAVLTQSQQAVRGLRVQKLRCDEVELFKPAVWEAAQLATKSAKLSRSEDDDPATVSGAIDALSTLHVPGGLMQRVLDRAAGNGTPVVRWCVIDVLERCEPSRDCASCELWNDCGGVAKTKCDGFISIDDAIAMKRRVSLETWNAEMLCKRPSVQDAVFPSFDPAVHVREIETDGEWSLAVDFGFAAPFVCLWICVEKSGRTIVVDEYVQPGRTVAEHAREIRARRWPTAAYLACDPAGDGRNEQTAASSVSVLKHEGFSVRRRASRIMDGVEQIRAALRPASGEPRLFVHPRCRHLIRALLGYRFARFGGAASELPLKDGEHDHLIDALRYHFVNRQTREAGVRRF